MDETATTRAADSRRLLGISARPAMDRLAELAARLLGTPSAQVSLLDEVQTVAGAAGAATRGSGPLEDSLCAVTAGLAAPLVVPDAVRDQRVAALPPVTSGALQSYCGVPLVAADGVVIGALCAFGPEPRAWQDSDVEVLTQLAVSVVAELELAALNDELTGTLTRFDLAIDAAGVGGFDWDLRTGQLLWDDRLLAMFGYDRTDFGRSIADFNARVHPDDLDRTGSGLQAAIDECGTYEGDYRIVLPDGTMRWVSARGQVLCDESGTAVRLLGAAFDTTDRHHGEARVSRVLESMTAAFFSVDRDWCFTYVNAEGEQLLGRSREELVGTELWQAFPAALGSPVEVSYRQAVRTGLPVSFDAYYPPPLDAWYEVRAWPGPDGLSVYFLDITARRTAQLQADRALQRSRLIADVVTELSDTLDAEEAVGRLARSLAPELADWCLVTLVDEDGTLRDVGRWHTDERQGELVRRYSALRLDALTEDSFLHRTQRSGRMSLVNEDATARIAEVLIEGEALDLLRALAPAAAAVLPMQARGRIVGLLSLFNGQDRGAYDALTLQTARDIAARAALALDNARLFQQQRGLAEQLQLSLLTPPPQSAEMQVAVRYVAAAETAQVGGDWYDAFRLPQGDTVLVIGDVVGHDSAAAAAMGQVRGLARGIAYTTEEGPAGVLSRLDAAVEGLRVGTTATAVVARLGRDEQGVRLTWSNAGHPPPMLLLPDGQVLVLAAAEADLLLGIDAGSDRAEHRAVLTPGSTVLLYTDGLVERRGQDLDEGLQRLSALLTELSALPLEELCDTVLRRLLPVSNEDDVALVAVRLP